MAANHVIEQLAELRRARRLSQREIARRMGTQQSAVCDLERGLTDPQWSTVQRYARAIGASVRVEVVPC